MVGCVWSIRAKEEGCGGRVCPYLAVMGDAAVWATWWLSGT